MSADLDGVRSTFDRLCEGWKTNDGEVVASFFTEDGSLINPFGHRADGRAAVAGMYSEYFAGMLQGTSTSIEVRNVRGVEDRHALADTEQTIYSADRQVLLSLHLTALLRRDGDDWLLVDGRPYAFATVPR